MIREFQDPFCRFLWSDRGITLPRFIGWICSSVHCTRSMWQQRSNNAGQPQTKRTFCLIGIGNFPDVGQDEGLLAWVSPGMRTVAENVRSGEPVNSPLQVGRKSRSPARLAAGSWLSSFYSDFRGLMTFTVRRCRVPVPTDFASVPLRDCNVSFCMLCVIDDIGCAR